MEERKIVAIVEDVEAARTALRWALHNILRHGDLLTLLHVFPTTTSRSSSRNSKKLRLLRLKGFQLALSFKDICNNFPNTKVDIVVKEGDREGRAITAIVRQIGATALVVGLHDQSFLYKAPDVPPPKIKYQICPNPSAIIWRRSKRSRSRSDQD